MVVENRIIEKCILIIFFNIENCKIDTYFKYNNVNRQAVWLRSDAV